jgi:tRNA-specific 2-thiouridylase
VQSLQNEYWKEVVQYTFDEAKQGRTPNPDIMCNSRIKFGMFYEYVGQYYAKIATGHYARVVYEGEGEQATLAEIQAVGQDRGAGAAPSNIIEFDEAVYEAPVSPTGRIVSSVDITPPAALAQSAVTAGAATISAASLPPASTAPSASASSAVPLSAPPRRARLVMSPDAVKDQTYFLSNLRQDQLAKALFPIGHLRKPQVRRLLSCAVQCSAVQCSAAQ